jgi:eukaryotic-like serine/threonine-protein kinase
MTAPSRSLKELFLAALEVAPEGRAAWLERECADAGLREHLRLMLAAHDAPQSLLDRPAGRLAASLPREGVGLTVDQPRSEGPGSIIGPYQLLGQIGEGGMGSVWLAQQTEPVKRLVALKLIKAGMDSAQVIARFEAERQALALMDHPNIARVLDGGTTPSGRPYFVMDLVKGVPITKYCDEHRLTPRQRLELVVPVCQAVQHAHQKGIIHRDLKPSNVLVALYDDQPIPKVIDFGVAKATGPHLTEETLHTGFGALVGTPEYMSPEQASVNPLDVDTRSDIYSLGALLYELLAGSPPFTRKELEPPGLLEMLRVIREQEPTRPSTRLSTAERLPALAANRGTEPRRLTALVRGEPDWIVMKCLEKDRARRYETANALATDLQRYLHDEPVLAGPPSAWYRFRKFARRNRGTLTASLLVVATVVAASVVTAVLGFLAWEQTAAALGNAKQQKRIAEKQRQRAEEKEQHAQQQRRRAIEVVDTFCTRVSQTRLLNAPGLQPLRRELLAEARKYYQDFVKEDPDNPALRAELANAYYRIGLLTSAIGSKEDALAAYDKALEIERQLRAGDGPPRHRALAVVLHNIGVLQLQTGRTHQAGQSLNQARAHWEELLKTEHVDAVMKKELPLVYRSLGTWHSLKGQKDQALEWLEKSRARSEELLKEHGDDEQVHNLLAATLAQAALVHAQAGNRPLAITLAEQARQLRHRLVSKNPLILDYRSALGRTCINLTALYCEQKQLDLALDRAIQAHELFTRLATENRHVKEHQAGHADSWSGLGGVQYGLDRAADALDSFQKARDIFAELLGGTKDNLDHVRGLAVALNGMAVAQARLAQVEEAVTNGRRAADHLEWLLQKDDRRPEDRHNLDKIYANLARWQRKLGRASEAVEAALKRKDLSPDNARARFEVGSELVKAAHTFGPGNRQLSATDRKRRRELAAQAVPLLEEAVAGGIKDEGVYVNLGDAWRFLGNLPRAVDAYRKVPGCAVAQLNLGALLCDDLKDHDGAIRAFQEAIRLKQDNPRAHANLSIALAKKADARSADNPKEAGDLFRRAIDHHKIALRSRPLDPGYHGHLRKLFRHLDKTWRELREHEALLASYRDAIAFMEKMPPPVRQKAEPLATLCVLEGSLAGLLVSLGKEVEAWAVLRQALRHAKDPAVRAVLFHNLGQLVDCFLRQGKHAEAAEAALDMGRQFTTVQAHRRAAGALARCVTLAEKDTNLPEDNRNELARQYGGQAVELLRQAVAAGQLSTKELRTAPLFSPLRTRADFRQLIAKLEDNKR